MGPIKSSVVVSDSFIVTRLTKEVQDTMAYKGSGKKAQSFTSRVENLGAPKKKGKSKGSKPVVLGGPDHFPRRDTGKTPAKRQTQRNHGTNRRGGRG